MIAAVSDVAQPVERAQLVGVYRFWRDFGFVVGALIAGVVADGFGADWAIAVVAALTARERDLGCDDPLGQATSAGATIGRRASRRGARADRTSPRLRKSAHRAMADGALLVDLRSHDERRRHGVIPGSLHIPRSVLEWRVDPDSGYTNPHIATLDRQLILFCAQGFSSSFAAASLRELGCSNATDLVGGFDAWKSAGLPVRPLDEDQERDRELPGMGGPEPPA